MLTMSTNKVLESSHAGQREGAHPSIQEAVAGTVMQIRQRNCWG